MLQQPLTWVVLSDPAGWLSGSYFQMLTFIQNIFACFFAQGNKVCVPGARSPTDDGTPTGLLLAFDQSRMPQRTWMEIEMGIAAIVGTGDPNPQESRLHLFYHSGTTFLF